MSLRSRLTILYIALLGGVILLFGGLVYALVSITLVNQIDASLSEASGILISKLRVNPYNQFDPRSTANVQTAESLVYQVWDNQRELVISRPITWVEPLDANQLRSGQITFSTTTSGNLHVRVLTIPLATLRGPIGVLQIAQNLYFLDLIQSTLAILLGSLALLAVLAAGVAAGLMIRRTLAPLESVTQVATQITKADDLSRRIPLTGSPDDEVGSLIQAFNQTLGRLEQLFNAQKRFLSDVSHELRTPLTVIKGNISLIRKFGEIDDESLSGIEMEVDRLTRLVGDLLLLGQAESGHMPLNITQVELDTVLLEVYNQVRLLAGERLKVELGEFDQIQVSGDRDRLKQVFLNLASNAVQYTPAGGTVTLGLKRDENDALITFKDTGQGISPEDLQHIFERFYRGEKSRKRSQGSGFGLGLSIAYWIVQNHGGKIEVQSGEGKGTTFTVRLPLQSEAK